MNVKSVVVGLREQASDRFSVTIGVSGLSAQQAVESATDCPDGAVVPLSATVSTSGFVSTAVPLNSAWDRFRHVAVTTSTQVLPTDTFTITIGDQQHGPQDSEGGRARSQGSRQ